MNLIPVSSSEIRAAAGPCSAAVKFQGLVFLSSQVHCVVR